MHARLNDDSARERQKGGQIKYMVPCAVTCLKWGVRERIQSNEVVPGIEENGCRAGDCSDDARSYSIIIHGVKLQDPSARFLSWLMSIKLVYIYYKICVKQFFVWSFPNSLFQGNFAMPLKRWRLIRSFVMQNVLK